ncbi:hypothetical protein FSP39_009451 [Pinctada imbricata]|uniref:Cadherin domain-containing protein n=1 Tax=Pinctada imbricata TaxID=66713 RepID=A0AA88Y781_PINIB|nr:hypothetical protein FSP39_009451 [Pinctada imbricata]
MAASVLLLSLFIASVAHAQTLLTFNFLEQKPRNTLVGDIANSSDLSKTLTDQELQSLQYTLVEQTSSVNISIFNLDRYTGLLTTTTVVDREDICRSAVSCVAKFGVIINSETFTNIYHFYNVEVIILDQNDNVPEFPTASSTIQLSENTPVGYLKTIDSATDLDVGINGIQSYEIVPSNGTFGLNVSKQLDGSYSVKVELKRSLDREVQSSYQFHVMAKDGAVPPNIGTLTINVEVLDVNDNAPRFEQNSYTVNVNESVSVNTIILRCYAQDRDINENGQVSYRFSPYQTDISVIQQTFSIDQQGYIKVISPLNFGIRNSYIFFVDAMDGGQEQRITQANVTVNILDTGNNKPVINLRFLSASNGNSVNISEGSNLDLAIAHVTVQDSDTGANGEVTCTILDPSFGVQNISSNMYVVTLKRKLDRETKSTHSVTVTCSDKGSPPLSVSRSFVVNVMDENDEHPVFSRNVYIGSVRENLGVGQVVTQISATDNDTGHNAIIRYFIMNGNDGRFAINDNTGVITSGMTFDREALPRINFTVLAVDSGNPKLTGTALVVVTISDDNDNAPEFEASHFQLYVMEGLGPQTNVGQISATDQDEGLNARISYGLADSTDSNLPFHLYPNGSLKTTATLDREFKDEYTFTVMAYDHGTPSKSSAADVTVIVADTNDNSPVVIFPNDTNDTVSISYLAPVGSYVTTIKAYDRDSPVNSELHFRIVHGNEREIFTLNPLSGELSMSNTFLIKEDTTFTLDIAVTDSGRPHRTETCKLRVILKFTNITAMQPLNDESSSKFVIISVVVVVFTVLVSAIILTIIILLRRSDRKREKEAQRREQNDEMYGELDKTYYQNGGLGYIGADLPKKKKEVSFSLDEDLDRSLDISHPSLLVDFQKPQNKSQHDSTSDTSTEMTTSDSGHGSSDIEVPTSANPADDNKQFSNHGYNRSSSFPPSQSSMDSGHTSSRLSNCADIYSVSAKHRDYTGLTPRETFERKHGLTSSVRKDRTSVHTSRPRSEGFSPSYV